MSTDKTDKTVGEYLGFKKNEKLAFIISLSLVLYIAVIIPNLPSKLLNSFDNWMLRIAFLIGIIYLSNNNTTLAIITSIAFLITLMMSNNKNITKYLPPEPMCNLNNDSCSCGNYMLQQTYADMDNNNMMMHTHTHIIKQPNNMETDNVLGVTDDELEDSYNVVENGNASIEDSAGLYSKLGDSKMHTMDEPEYPTHVTYKENDKDSYSKLGDSKMHTMDEPEYPTHVNYGKPSDTVKDVMNDTEIVNGVYQNDLDDNMDACPL